MRSTFGRARITRQREDGFTLIEVLVAVVLLSVCLIGMAQFFASAGGRVMDSETRALLHQIATRELEDIRALPYNSIGTKLGNPTGPLLDVEETTIEGVPVKITREVVFVQDPSYSGPYPANYRRVTIVVRATDSSSIDAMQISSIVAGGAEGGSLDITVTTLAGNPVPNAQLHIVNNNLIPRVNIGTSAIRTDTLGHLLVPGLKPDSSNGYYVTASKAGFSEAATPSGLVVVKGTPFTVVQLIIDKLSSLSIHVTDGTGAPVADVALTVTGHLSVAPWVFSKEVVTDAGGNASLPNLRYATSLQPVIVRTTAAYNPFLRLPSGVDPDPIDPGTALANGQIGLIIEPGTTRSIELVLPTP